MLFKSMLSWIYLSNLVGRYSYSDLGSTTSPKLFLIYVFASRSEKTFLRF